VLYIAATIEVVSMVLVIERNELSPPPEGSLVDRDGSWVPITTVGPKGKHEYCSRSQLPAGSSRGFVLDASRS
jgi:hypothetical protein